MNLHFYPAGSWFCGLAFGAASLPAALAMVYSSQERGQARHERRRVERSSAGRPSIPAFAAPDHLDLLCGRVVRDYGFDVSFGSDGSHFGARAHAPERRLIPPGGGMSS